VGHKYGGILIKSLIIEVNKVAHRKKFADLGERRTKDSCEAFQHNLSGIMFYGVPHFMTTKDIQIMFDHYEKIEGPKSVTQSSGQIYQKLPESSGQKSYHKLSAWEALAEQILDINADFEDSIGHDHPEICVISHGLTMEVNSLTFMLHHVLDDGHINILAFVQGHPYGKS
jgi:hypothetical protein